MAGGSKANNSGKSGEDDFSIFIKDKYNVLEKNVERVECVREKKSATKITKITGSHKDGTKFFFEFKHSDTYESDIRFDHDAFTSWQDSDGKVVRMPCEIKNQNTQGSVTKKILSYAAAILMGWEDFYTIFTNDADFLKKYEVLSRENKKLNGRFMIVRKRDWGRFIDVLEGCRKQKFTTQQTIEEFKKFNRTTVELESKLSEKIPVTDKKIPVTDKKTPVSDKKSKNETTDDENEAVASA